MPAYLLREPDPQAEADADAEAWRDFEAGRVISHEAMREWILSWGSAEERPVPKVGD